MVRARQTARKSTSWPPRRPQNQQWASEYRKKLAMIMLKSKLQNHVIPKSKASTSKQEQLEGTLLDAPMEKERKNIKPDMPQKEMQNDTDQDLDNDDQSEPVSKNTNDD